MHATTSTDKPKVLTVDAMTRAIDMLRNHNDDSIATRMECRQAWHDLVLARYAAVSLPSQDTPIYKGIAAVMTGVPIYINDDLPDGILCRMYNAKGNIIYSVKV